MIGRVFRIVRVPITLLVLLCVLSYGAWWGYTNVIADIPPAPPAPCVQQPVRNQALQTNQVTVSVYNGGNRRGLAGDVARALRESGFKVAVTDNTETNVNTTVIVGAGAKNPEVLLVQSFLKGAKVQVDKTRVDRSVDVLVGNGYSGFNGKAKRTIAVKAPSVCLPSARPSTAVLGG